MISFIVGNVTLGVLIRLYGNIQLLIIFRVVLLDGLFLVMGITLGICIIVVGWGGGGGEGGRGTEEGRREGAGEGREGSKRAGGEQEKGRRGAE